MPPTKTPEIGQLHMYLQHLCQSFFEQFVVVLLLLVAVLTVSVNFCPSLCVFLAISPLYVFLQTSPSVLSKLVPLIRAFIFL